MPIGISYNPLGAIAQASRQIGFGQFVKQQQDDEERRRRAEAELAMQAQRLRSQIEQDAFDRALAQANLQEGSRRFNVGTQMDLQNRQQDQSTRQQALAAGLAGKQADNTADLQARQYTAGAQRAMAQDRLNADLLKQQLDAEQEGVKQAALTQRQMELAALQGDSQLRNRLIGSEIDPQIAQGIRDGSLKYSDRDKKEMQQLQESIRQARADKNLSPAERMAFEAQQMERYNELRDNPQEVPYDERPVPLQEQYEQQTLPIMDASGQEIGRKHSITRNGSTDWKYEYYKPSPAQEAEQKRQEFELKQQHEQAQQEQKNREWNQKLREQENTFLQEQLKREYNNRMTALDNEMPGRVEFETDIPATETTPKSTEFDKAGFDKAMADYRSKVSALNQEFRDRQRLLPLPPPSLTAPFPAQVPAIPGQSAPAEMLPPAPPAPVEQQPLGDPIPPEQAGVGFGGGQSRGAGFMPPEYVGGGSGYQENGATGHWTGESPPPVASVEEPQELVALIQSGQLQEGDIVMTPKGPRPLTPEVIQKLMGGI